MFSRRALQLTVAGATLVAVIGNTVPAAASVRYDPQTKSGFADAADVRTAFGWSDAMLATRAAGLLFNHDFWTEDLYYVWCGKGPFPVKHQREFGRFELTDIVIREPRHGAPTGYGGHTRRPVGFRIAGPHAGISGTSLPPAVGQPCPEPRGPLITRTDPVSTTTGWSLNVSSGDVSKVLRTGVALVTERSPGARS